MRGGWQFRPPLYSRFMSILHIASVWRDEFFTPSNKSELLVALVLADCARGEDGLCWPSVGYIAKKARMTERGVYLAIDNLAAAGRIRKSDKKTKNGGNVYYVCLAEQIASFRAGTTPTELSSPLNSVHPPPELSSGVPLNTVQGNRNIEPSIEPSPQPPKGGSGFDEEKKRKQAERKAETEAAAERIYAAYPRKEHRAEGLTAICRALKTHSEKFLLERTLAYAESRKGEDPKFTPVPATWFNGKRFLDEQQQPQQNKHENNSPYRAVSPANRFSANAGSENDY